MLPHFTVAPGTAGEPRRSPETPSYQPPAAYSVCPKSTFHLSPLLATDCSAKLPVTSSMLWRISDRADAAPVLIICHTEIPSTDEPALISGLQSSGAPEASNSVGNHWQWQNSNQLCATQFLSEFILSHQLHALIHSALCPS